MINEIVLFLLFYAFFFIYGIILLNVFFRKALIKLPFMLVFILSVTLGLATYIILLSVSSYFLISQEILIVLLLISVSLFIIGVQKKRIKFGTFKPSINLTILIILLFSIIYVAYYLTDCPWHAADDAKTYGFLTSLLSYNNKNTGTFLPYSSNLLHWDAGVSVLSVYVANLGGILNGRAIMVTGALAVVLIPVLLYAIVFSYTRKNSLSSLAALTSFNIYFLPYGLSLWNRFFTGNYGNLFGILFLYLYIWIISNLSSQEKFNKFYFTLFPILASFFVYPGYLIHMFLFNLFLIGSEYYKTKSLNKDFKITLILMLSVAFFLGMLFIGKNLFPKEIIKIFWPILEKFSSDRPGSAPLSINNPGYSLDLSFFGYGIESIIMIPLLIITLIAIYNGKKLRTNFTYFFIFFSIIVSTHSILGLTTALFLIPKRVALALFPLIWIMVFIIAYHYLEHFPLPKFNLENKLTFHYKDTRRSLGNLVILLIAVILALSCLLPHITYSFAKENSYYAYSSYFEPNYSCAVWINENVDPSDLILNDMSFTGYFLLSMNIFNLTYADPITYFSEYQDRGKDLWAVWNEPLDEVNVRNKLFENNVSYILSDSDYKFFSQPFFDPLTKQGWDKKTHHPSEIAVIFDSYPFLEKVFEYNDARIYKVDKEQLVN